MYKEAWKTIQKASRVVLVSHKNPDCDAIGSMCALFSVLKKEVKKVSLFNATKEIPSRYDFLFGYSKIKDKMPENYDLLVVLDCADFKRTGIEENEQKIINIDHHPTNTLFGDINLVEPDLPSASAVVHKLLKENDIKITQDCAVAIYAALVEDSGFFKFENVDHKTFDLSSELVKAGANPAKISKKLTERNSLARFRLAQEFLDTVTFLCDAKIARGFLTLEAFQRSGAVRADSEDFVQLPRSLATVELSMFFLELATGGYKVSLRSKDYLDVSRIALYFGGGGHKRAAGFDVEEKDIEKITQQIVRMYKEQIQHSEW